MASDIRRAEDMDMVAHRRLTFLLAAYPDTSSSGKVIIFVPQKMRHVHHHHHHTTVVKDPPPLRVRRPWLKYEEFSHTSHQLGTSAAFPVYHYYQPAAILPIG